VPAVCFYISGHGFGHASRQIEVINALARLEPSESRTCDIIVRTSAPAWLFDRTAQASITLLPGPCDTGISQFDSLRLDERATAAQAAAFYQPFREHALHESRLLREHGVELVISDAPPLACAAAAAAGVPSIVLSNFTWDWIYEAYQEAFASLAPEVIPVIGTAYASAAQGWRLPLHGGFATVPKVLDLPYVARHARHPKQRVRDGLGIPPGRPVALSSFGGYGVRDFDPATLDCRDRWTVILTGRGRPAAMPSGVLFVDEAQIYAAGFRYEDLVAAVDAVVTKPGYGIVSECIANDTAVLYTSRGHFAEYDVMVREMPRVIRCRFLEQDALLAGRWLESLDRLLDAPPAAERPATNGADVAAAEILLRLRG
jgi:L-arabinokinase